MAQSTSEKKSADVEMKDTAAGGEEKPKELTPEQKEKAALALLYADFKSHINDIEKTVHTKESRFQARVLRQLKTTRKKLTAEVLSHVLQTHLQSDQAHLEELLKYVSKHAQKMDTGSVTTKPQSASTPSALSPESAAYLHTLVLLFLLDKKFIDDAIQCSSSLVKRIQPLNRRTLSPLSAKAYFYFARSHELAGRSAEIRGTLLGAYRTATLRHDDETQATVLNLLLRNYLEHNLVDQAEKLVANSSVKEASISNNQFARYLYYQGRIKSIQLEYTEACQCLLQAIRKAPQYAAVGFRLTAYKLLCIVQLLTGEIPEKSIFRQRGLKKQLRPYFELTQAVNVGSLTDFQRVVTTYQNLFAADKTLTLITRLRHNVIKTGLRKINLAYSRISFADICAKLRLDSATEAEYIVAKAIRDGVIDATIDHVGGFVQSKEVADTYSSAEPIEALNKRIDFCLNIHNEAVRAMRFPPNASKPDYQSDEARRERAKQEQEIANSLAKEDSDDF